MSKFKTSLALKDGRTIETLLPMRVRDRQPKSSAQICLKTVRANARRPRHFGGFEMLRAKRLSHAWPAIRAAPPNNIRRAIPCRALSCLASLQPGSSAPHHRPRSSPSQARMVFVPEPHSPGKWPAMQSAKSTKTGS